MGNIEIELPHNQLILSTGKNAGTILFEPLRDETPADLTEKAAFTSTAYMSRRVSISGGSEEGWDTPLPDAGGTSLSINAVPVGEPYILLLCAAIYGIIQAFRRKKRLLLILFASICTGHIAAAITGLTLSPSAAVRGGERVMIAPTISAAPSGTAILCWGMYRDADCTSAVDSAFSRATSVNRNAVQCTMPRTAGTYYIKSTLKTGKTCEASEDSYVVTPIIVYPEAADVVLTRDGQAAAERVNLTSASTKRAYGAMRFSKAGLNDDTQSAYKRYNYFVSFPFDVQVADIYGIGTVGTHWRIYFYDGKGRAEEGFFAERTDNWKMIDDTDSVLHAGQGYLLQLNSIRMAADRTDVWPNGADIATLFFPALSTFSDFTTENETIPALNEAYRCTIDLSASLGSEGDRTIKDSYWRCIGVPSFESPSGVSALDYLYAWNPEDNSLSVVSSAGYTFLPAHAYLVQHGGQIVWTEVTRPAAIVAQRTEPERQEWKIELKQGETVCDRTYVRLSDEEDVTADFDFGHDLSKELNAGKANIYTMVGYERLAANCLPDSTTTAPIGVRIAQSGEYQIYVQSNDASCTIYDSVTGVRAEEHTVYLEAGMYEGRFAIQTGEAVSTSVQNAAYNAQTSEVQKVMLSGRLYIVKGGKMYDLWGRFVQKSPK